MQYAAFLRGINVGGNSKVPMNKLKKAFEELGFSNVKTLLNSGNVVFEAAENPTNKIEEKLEQTFGFKISVMVRTLEEIQNLINSDPFHGIEVTPKIRLYVTFYSEKLDSKLKIPYESPDEYFKILQVKNGTICSALIISPDHGSVDLMGMIEKEFGKKVTTRNWNTIIKVSRLLTMD